MDKSREKSRREFLTGVKRWSGAVAAVAVAGRIISDSAPATAGAWANRGGSWVNRYGGGSWVNGGGGWINRGGSWINGSGGGWINRYGGGSWVNRH